VTAWPKLRAFALGAALQAAVLGAQAGRSCEHRAPAVATIGQAMTLAEHTARVLDASGAQVVVLARRGQNLDAYGLRYSHLGLAYRDAGRWRVVHKLNECGTAHAAIFRQGLGEFFLDDLYEYEAALVVPAPAVQAALLAALPDNARIAQLNTPAYSMVAYPWAQTYQQSNQWALETLALTQDPAASTRLPYTRASAQAWLRLHGYEPTALHISALQRLGGRLAAANIAFDDHPNAKRFTDRIETVTVDSVFAWLNRSGLGGPVQVIR
jgi:hypothetical protein